VEVNKRREDRIDWMMRDGNSQNERSRGDESTKTAVFAVGNDAWQRRSGTYLVWPMSRLPSKLWMYNK
jgi:hypothetical protein